MIFKLTFAGDTYRFTVNNDTYNKFSSEFLNKFEKQLIEKIQEISMLPFPMKYKDEDGDLICIRSGDDLSYHIEHVWFTNEMEKVHLYI